MPSTVGSIGVMIGGGTFAFLIGINRTGGSHPNRPPLPPSIVVVPRATTTRQRSALMRALPTFSSVSASRIPPGWNEISEQRESPAPSCVEVTRTGRRNSRGCRCTRARKSDGKISRWPSGRVYKLEGVPTPRSPGRPH